jgi:hypothetical protein
MDGGKAYFKTSHQVQLTRIRILVNAAANKPINPHPSTYFSTRKCATGAECKQNLSETIAKEPRGLTQYLVVTFLVMHKGSRFLQPALS